MSDLLDAPVVPETTGSPDAAVPAARSPFAAPTGPPVVASSPAPEPVAAVQIRPPVVQVPTPVASPTGPMLSADPSMNPLVGAGPELPMVPAVQAPSHQPRQDQPRPLPGTLPVDMSQFQAPTAARQPLVRWRAVFSTVFWLCALAGLSYAGAMYGPELYEEHFGDTEATTALAGTPTLAEEPPAPLAFPVAAVPPVVAAASFDVVGQGPDGPIEYSIITDFASGDALTTITRPSGAPLEIITTGDQALIRRLDERVWYRSPRGGFPLDGQLTRTQWVRLVDELFPVETRLGVAIDAASRSTVAGTPARRLEVTVSAAQLPPAPSIPSLRRQLATPAPGLAATAAIPAAPETPLAPVDPSAAATTVAPADQVSPPVRPAPSATAPTTSATTTIEIWVDDSGIIRQAIAPQVFGVDRLTVTEAMPAPWAPLLPPDELIQPLDADAVVHLGL